MSCSPPDIPYPAAAGKSFSFMPLLSFLFHWFISYVDWCPLQTGLHPELVITSSFCTGLIPTHMIKESPERWFCASVQCDRHLDHLRSGEGNVYLPSLCCPSFHSGTSDKCQEALYLSPWLSKLAKTNQKIPPLRLFDSWRLWAK